MRITRDGLQHYLQLSGPRDREFILAVLSLLEDTAPGGLAR